MKVSKRENTKRRMCKEEVEFTDEGIKRTEYEISGKISEKMSNRCKT